MQISRDVQNIVNTLQPCLPSPQTIPMLPDPPIQNDVSIVSSNTTTGGDNLQGVNINYLFNNIYEERSQISRMVSTNKIKV